MKHSVKSPFYLDIDCVLRLEAAKFKFYKQVDDLCLSCESLYSLQISSYDKLYEVNAVLNHMHEVSRHFIALKKTFAEIKELNWQCLEIICAFGLLFKFVFRDEFEYEQLTDSIMKLKDSIFLQQRNESPLKFFESDTYCVLLVSGDVKELARIMRCN